MICPECGQDLPADAEACSHCEAAVETRALPTAETPRRPVPENPFHFPPGTHFAGRFTIIELVGEGGMAYVYKAIDQDLGQIVALKLIKPELAVISRFADRFKREVRVTRQITHPNACRVYDYGESDGILFLTMKWVEGESLRQLLHHARTLTEERALEITEKIALALGDAHAKGIIHRDLKPENIMIDDQGDVFVMDFGIATEPGGDRITESGLIPGTLKYMAPEQRNGEGADELSDLYSLGLILEEMLEGDSRTWNSESSTHGHTEITARVAPVLKSLLAEDRSQRYTSAEMVADKLRGIRFQGSILGWINQGKDWVSTSTARVAITAVAAVVVVAALLVATNWDRINPPPEPLTPAQVYYERGLHYLVEEVETERNLNDSINMFSRSIARDPTYPLAWAMLGDAYWRQFERTDDPTFRKKAEESIARAFELDPDLPEAHNAKARGLIYEGLYDEAVHEAERAIELNPEYDMAWAYLGRAHQMRGDYDEGLKALKRATELNPESFQHHMFAGNFYQHFREYDAAIEAYREAADLKPDSPMSWNNIGTICLRTKKPKEAIVAFEKSIALQDRAATRTNIGIAYYMMEDYEAAVPYYQRATELDPDKATYWGNLGEALRILDREPEAVDAFGHAVELAKTKVELTPLDPHSRRRLALWCARARNLECAAAEAQIAYEMMPEDAQILLMNAIVCCLMGNQDDSLGWLEQAVNFGMGKAEIEMEPDLVALHSHPRYRELLQQAG
jgi:serine/threonine protein kinase